MTCRFAVPQDYFGVEKEGFRILNQNLGQPLCLIALLLNFYAGLFAYKIILLFQLYKHSQTGLIGVICIVHIMAIITVAFFHPQAVQGF